MEINEYTRDFPTHICHSCGKGFSSGKALGGHRRFHVQQERRHVSSAGNPFFLKAAPNPNKFKKPENHSYDDHRGRAVLDRPMTMNHDDHEGNNKNLTCCLCLKDFPSMKSLSGHMRSHPEREWRGIHPPATSPIAFTDRMSSSDESGKQIPLEGQDHHQLQTAPAVDNVDLSQLLSSSWSKTDKRGRKTRTNSAVAVAADGLIGLSRGKSKTLVSDDDQSSTMMKDYSKKKLKVKADSEMATLLRFSTCRKDDHHHHHNQDYFSPGTYKQLNHHHHNQDYFSPGTYKQLNHDNIIGCCNNSLVEKKLRKKQNKYCLEEKKRKGTSIVSTSSSSSTETEDNASLIGSSSTKIHDQKVIFKSDTMGSDHKLYKCSSCEKSFSTFQALGGHRSTHNKDNKKKIISSRNSTITTTPSKNFNGKYFCDKTSRVDQIMVKYNSQFKIRDNNIGRDGTKLLFPSTPTTSTSTTRDLERCDYTMRQRDVRELLSELANSNTTRDRVVSSEVGVVPQSTSGGRRRMLDFDLNELPCDDE